jgi:hypothetical protein
MAGAWDVGVDLAADASCESVSWIWRFWTTGLAHAAEVGDGVIRPGVRMPIGFLST